LPLRLGLSDPCQKLPPFVFRGSLDLFLGVDTLLAALFQGLLVVLHSRQGRTQLLALLLDIAASLVLLREPLLPLLLERLPLIFKFLPVSIQSLALLVNAKLHLLLLAQPLLALLV
jgi:hypothetical protein